MKNKQNQLEKFTKKAQELECDESDSAFEAALSKLAKQPPVPKPTKKDKPAK